MGSMGIAAVVLEYLKVLVWPLVAVICFFIIRAELFRLLTKLSELDVRILGFRLRMRTAARIAGKTIRPAGLADAVQPEQQDRMAEVIWSLSDQDLLFIHELVKRPWQDSYYATGREETWRYNGLCNEQLFVRLVEGHYQPTELGRRLFDYLQDAIACNLQGKTR
ncbi:hypothetical protein [Endozoicomonas sp.]|uniref:hypothetical protein n=1 Tax=Endozoicomonas sp. TaxID=1892382 RepID=UPI00383BAA0B